MEEVQCAPVQEKCEPITTQQCREVLDQVCIIVQKQECKVIVVFIVVYKNECRSVSNTKPSDIKRGAMTCSPRSVAMCPRRAAARYRARNARLSTPSCARRSW